MNALNIIHVSQEISEYAIDLVEEYSKSHNLAIPDALIASTAIHHSMKLFTYNLRDFQYIEKLELYEAGN